MLAPIAVAALSVRILAEAVRDGGYRTVALDLFGDVDTRRAAQAWLPLGAAATLSIDGDALLTALHRLRACGAAGWIAGSGFEANPELLAAGAQILPLIGNPPDVVARVRSPAEFFGRLAKLRIPHPETRRDCPPSPLGWLRKDFASSGGREVRSALPERFDLTASAGPNCPQGAGVHYQRITPGIPMSALFVADGRRGRLIGVNRQIVRKLRDRPYVFRGCVGPVPVASDVRRKLEDWVDALAADFGVRGVNGLDFLLDGDHPSVLELNPRPPASIALYRDALRGGLLRAHVVACLEGELPDVRDVSSSGWTSKTPARIAMTGAARATDPCAATAGAQALHRGFEVVFARRPCILADAASAALARLDWCHDLPAAGTRFEPGDPVCTVSAADTTVGGVQARLARRRRLMPSLLEQADEGSSEGLRAHQLECQ
ncbi:ATP-grasp domain-containing protein [Aromatoleum sp.]|uniref:ATP-grasp domain-containing protein n=1 Tax=Aromatoleum sp. TaxID=2307007 RepID=UPI002FC7D218